MDTKFQTSFIPKKPILMDQKVVHHGSTTSIFMFISVLVFIFSIAGAVFSLIWKDVLIKQQTQYAIDLKKAESRFDIATIEKLKKASVKIDTATQLLKNHLAVSEIFNIISLLTADGIRFTSFEFSPSTVVSDPNNTEASNGIKISMKGVGSSFSAIAWQSDVFGKSAKFGTNKVVKNPILTDLQLDPLTGNVAFSFTAEINPEDLNYEKQIIGESAQPVGNTQ